MVDRLETAKLVKEYSSIDLKSKNEEVMSLMHENEQIYKQNRAIEKLLKEVDSKTQKAREQSRRQLDKLRDKIDSIQEDKMTMEQQIGITQNDRKGLKSVADKEVQELNNCIVDANRIIRKLQRDIKMVSKVDGIRAATIKNERQIVDKKIGRKA